MTDRPDAGMPLPGIRWRGLTLQLFLLTFLPLTVLMLVIAFGSQMLHHDAMRSLVGDRDLRAVQTAAAGLDGQIQQRADTLAVLAAETGSPDQQGAALWQRDFDGGLALLSPAGEVQWQSQPLPIGAESLRAALSQKTPQPGIPAFTQPMPVNDTYWTAAAALRTDGSTLVGLFDTGKLLRQVVSANFSGPEASTLVVDSNQQILFQAGGLATAAVAEGHPGITESLRGESGINYFNHHEDEHIVSFAPIAQVGWGLVVEESWESISSPLLRNTQAAPLVLAPVLVVALIGLWFGARQVIQPLQTLEARAARLAEGDFESIREPVSGIEEVQRLQTQLAGTAQKLQAAQENLHRYIGSITAGLENERRSLARDLHDDTLQALIALGQRVQLISLDAQNPAAQRSLDDVEHLVQGAIVNLRQVVRGLRPIYLEDLGLVAALEMLAGETGQKQPGLQVDFACRGQEQRLPPDVELTFYRLAQEALNNMTHHARASHASLAIDFSDQRLSLSVQDNGVGFTAPDRPDAFAHAGHFGLLGMQERAELVGGELEIKTQPGQGTRITVSVPLSPSSGSLPDDGAG